MLAIKTIVNQYQKVALSCLNHRLMGVQLRYWSKLLRAHNSRVKYPICILTSISYCSVECLLLFIVKEGEDLW